jgi:hypothetical protein
MGDEPLTRPSASPEDARPGELPAERRPTATRSYAGAILLLALAVGPTALLVRWNAVDRFPGRLFQPYPDAKEYVASAQAIRQTGRFFLQVGPHRAPPRYPPGWPLVLAAAFALSIPPERTPEIVAVFDALHALLIAVATAFFCRWLRHPTAGAPFLPADLLAGMVAGWGWAFTPIAVSLGVVALSDVPTAAVVDAMFLLLLVGTLRRGRRWISSLVFLAAGLLLGLAIAMRPFILPLVAGSVVLLGIAHWVNGSRRLFVLSLTSFLAGVAIPVACTATLMSRSGWGPWSWSHYAFWVREFSDLGAVFRWLHLIEGNPDLPILDPISGKAFGHLRLALHLFAGVPLGRHQPGLGWVWPTIAWLVGGAVACDRALQGRDSERRLNLLVIAAFATLILSHIVLFGTYFYPAPRFYLLALAPAWVLLGGTVGHLGQHRSPVFRAAALVALVLTAFAVKSELQLFLERPTVPSAEMNERDLRAPFRAWSMVPDDLRRELPVPFDPVRAQAMGLLPPSALSGISEWGPLPETEHTIPLRARGLIE